MIFEKEVKDETIKEAADTLEIQGELITLAAKGLLDSLKNGHKHRCLHYILQLKKATERANQTYQLIGSILP